MAHSGAVQSGNEMFMQSVLSQLMAIAGILQGAITTGSWHLQGAICSEHVLL